MSLRTQIEAASAARAKTRRKLVEVPGGSVEMRGMMSGDLLRVGEEQQKFGLRRAMRLVVAICAYDPESGEQMWNPNDGSDLEKISALDSEVFDPLRDAGLELSGLAPAADEGAEGNETSPPTRNGSSFSPESSGGALSLSGAT